MAYCPAYVQKIRDEMDTVFSEERFSVKLHIQFLNPSSTKQCASIHRYYLVPNVGHHLKGCRVAILSFLAIWLPTCLRTNFTTMHGILCSLMISSRNGGPRRVRLNRSAFLPFLIGKLYLNSPSVGIYPHLDTPISHLGPNNCPGKPLAMIELRSVIARTLNEFDVFFHPGVEFDLSFFRGVKDHIVAGVRKQELVFTKRQR
jgi:hypothetical protein